MNTANTFSGSLYLSCTVPSVAETGSTCAISYFFVYSTNPIAFKVQNCYTPKTPANILLDQNSGSGIVTLFINSTTIMNLEDSSCPISCTITPIPAYLTLTALNSTHYKLDVNTNSAVAST
jgi:hypothetical protein